MANEEKQLFSVKTRGCGTFHVVATSFDAAAKAVSDELNSQDYGYSGDRRIMQVEHVCTEQWMKDGRRALYGDGDENHLIVCHEDTRKHCYVRKQFKKGDEADTKSQTYALSAFRCIKEHWQREKRLEQYKQHPVIHIKREFQVTTFNFDKIQELSNEGVFLMCSFDVNREPTISVTLKDGHTIVKTGGWLMQDTEGRWWGMDNGYHRMLEQYQKIVIDGNGDHR